MKHYLGLFTLLLLISTTLHAQGVDGIEGGIRAKGRSTGSSSSRSYERPEEKSGYTSQVHVVGQRRVFVRKRFSPSSFKRWTSLFNKAKTYEEIKEAEETGRIGAFGVIRSSSVKIAGRKRYRGEVINLNRMVEEQGRAFNSRLLFDRLVENNVLTREGYIVDSQNYVDLEMGRVDLSYLRARLRRVVWNLNNKPLHADLVEDLRRLILDESQVLIVTQKETTRYQSRKDNLGDSILDQFLGNLAGSVMFRDQVKESREAIRWSPNINLPNHFPTLVAGFNAFPYAYGQPGPITLFGSRRQFQIEAQRLTADKIQETSGRILYRGQIMSSINQITYWEGGIHYKEIEDSTADKLGLGVGTIGFGMSTEQTTNTLRFGLSYLDGNVAKNIGIHMGWDGRYYLIYPISISGAWQQSSGLTFKQEDGWTIGDVKAALNVHLDRATISGGYQWTYGLETSLYDNLFLNVGINF